VKAERTRESAPDRDLLDAAQAAARQAYAPYSRFRVGCAVRTASGAVYTGCNVENASYPAGLCAERNALAAAIAAEGPTASVERILIYAIGPDDQHTACTPCGLCRQVIYEIAPNALVGMFTGADQFLELAI